MAKHNLTKEAVLNAEHDLLSEVSMWERETPEDAMKLGFYNEGIHDMASAILRLLEELDNAK